MRRFLATRPTRVGGGLADVLALRDGLTGTTRLRRRPGHPCVLLADPGRPDRLDVLLGDRTLTVPSWLRPALEEVRRRTALTPADLAMLDPESRVVLCSRLVREGLLAVVDAGP